MIKNILINGVSVNLENKRLISQIAGLTSPQIEVKSFSRGGGEGMTLSRPCYRGLSLSFAVVIMADSLSNLVREKQRFVSLLSIEPTIDKWQKEFTFVLADDKQLKIKGAVTNITHDLRPDEIGRAEVLVQVQTEKSYLRGQEKIAQAGVFELGGMAIPMSIPMAMNLTTEVDYYTQLNNIGSAYGQLKLRVDGPMAGMALVNQTTGQRIQITQVLEAGEWLTLDFEQRQAKLNDQVNILGKVSGSWWTVAPGINQVLFAANESNEQTKATIFYHDAYLGI